MTTTTRRKRTTGPRFERIYIRVTAEEKARYQRLAAAQGMSLGAWLCALADREIETGGELATPKEPA